MLNEKGSGETLISSDPKNNNTIEKPSRQGGNLVNRFHEAWTDLKQSRFGLDVLYPLHEVLKDPKQVLGRFGRYSPNIIFAAEVFATGGAVAVVASAEMQTQPDLELKEIKGVDKDGRLVEFIQFYDGRGKDPDKDSKPVIVHQIFPQGWENDEAGLKAAKQAVLEGYLTKPLIKEIFGGKDVFLYRKQSTLVNLECDQNGSCPSGNPSDPFEQEVDRSIFALSPIMLPPVLTTVFIKSLDGTPNGRTDPVFDRRNKVASPYVFSGVVYAEKDTPNRFDKRVFLHETLWGLGIAPNPDPAVQQISATGTGSGDQILPDDEAFLRQLATMNNGNFGARFQTPEFKTYNNTKPGYSVNSATNYVGINIPVDLPVVTTQYRLGVYPSANPLTGIPDGPAIELIIGDRRMIADVVQNKRIFIPAPKMGEGNYVLLPDTYSYKLCISADTLSVPWAPISGWEKPISIWPNGLTVTNQCKEGEFNTRTAQMPTSKTIHPIGLENGSLKWTNDDPTIFYYEIQVSGDEKFDTNPDTATSFVWWNLVHGGITNNSWKLPPAELDTRLYWRIRPRIQGQSTPVDWSETWNFTK